MSYAIDSEIHLYEFLTINNSFVTILYKGTSKIIVGTLSIRYIVIRKAGRDTGWIIVISL